MNVVIITTSIRNPPVASLVRALAHVEHPPTAIVVARPRNVSVVRFLLFEVILAVFRPHDWLRRSREPRGPAERPWRVAREHGARVRMSLWPIGHERVVRILNAVPTDVLLHVGGPIFRPPTIRAPRVGLLNCHMGRLPEMRGVNVAEWSVLLGRPVGNTVHFIDEGIDTGGIIMFRQRDVSDLDSVAKMRRLLSGEQFSDLADAVHRIAQPGFTPTRQALSEGRQYYRMHPALLAVVEKRLQQGYVPPATPRCVIAPPESTGRLW